MKKTGTTKTLTAAQTKSLLETLEARFKKHPQRHQGALWDKVLARLAASPSKLWSLNELERTGGEPDVVGHDAKSGEFTFMDCSAETPKDRRSVCFDEAALASRKENKPKGSAHGLATGMGVELLTEAQYAALQAVGEFDLKTSSWLETPRAIRALGGALFGDRRYGRVFTYHNGVESYYAARAFRGVLHV
jgi:hypothetical protein